MRRVGCLVAQTSLAWYWCNAVGAWGARCPHLLQVTESRCSTMSCSEACFRSAIVGFTLFGGGNDATGSFSIASRVVSAARMMMTFGGAICLVRNKTDNSS